MLITLLTTGTRGDIQPFLALAAGLKTAGHSIRVATQKSFKELVLEQGFEFAPLPGDAFEFLASEEGQQLLGAGGGLRFFLALMARFDQSYEPLLDACLRACIGTEAIIFNGLTLAGCHIAEAMEVPVFTATFVPIAPTGSFASSTFPKLNLGRRLNFLTFLLQERPFWLRYMERTNRWRAKALGLPPIPASGAYVYFNRRQLPWLNCYSRHLVPAATDWPRWMHVTGYWHLVSPTGSEWQPCRKLARFLEAGPPPVYVGFGSMFLGDGAARTRLVVEALRLSGQRALLSKGWGGLNDVELPGNVLTIGDTPHDWLFPKVSVVVHHGGAGTTHAAVRAGIPSVVMPFFGDQFYWGARLAQLGAAPEPIPQRSATAASLARAIAVAATKDRVRTMASALGQRTSQENGVYQAVDAFHQELDRPGRFLALGRS